jgi:hypothetical protein
MIEPHVRFHVSLLRPKNGKSLNKQQCSQKFEPGDKTATGARQNERLTYGG